MKNFSNKWISDLAPNNVIGWDHYGLDFWKDIYGWIDKVDNTKVCPIISFSDDYVSLRLEEAIANYTIIVISSFCEPPRFDTVLQLAQLNLDKKFIWLGDFDVYDFFLPANVTFVKYPHNFLWLMWYKDYVGYNTITKVKDKKIIYKFSSLSWLAKMHRAVATASVITHEPSQSLISWHKKTATDYHDSQVEDIKSFDKLSHLDWTSLDSEINVDMFNQNVEDIVDSFNCDSPAYNNCLINITNETSNFGWLSDGTRSFNRPGPYISEKTFKPLLSGCLLLSNGQPNLYNFLRDTYNIDCKYSFNLSYDTLPGDFDRLVGLDKTINYLSKIDLQDLIDANIDTCENIQNNLLNTDWILYNMADRSGPDEEITRLCSL